MLIYLVCCFSPTPDGSGDSTLTDSATTVNKVSCRRASASIPVSQFKLGEGARKDASIPCFSIVN